MQVLMPETSTSGARMAADALREAGHDVHTCHEPDATGFLCTGMHGNPCPLEAFPIDVAVDVRPFPMPMPTLDEDGVRCAARRHIPLVVAGAVAANPFAPWTTVESSTIDVVEAVEAAVASPLPDLSARATEVLRGEPRAHGRRRPRRARRSAPKGRAPGHPHHRVRRRAPRPSSIERWHAQAYASIKRSTSWTSGRAEPTSPSPLSNTVTSVEPERQPDVLSEVIAIYRLPSCEAV